MIKSKYKNKKTNGFDSKAENKRAIELRLMEKAGLISDLQFQNEYELLPSQRDESGKVIERPVKYRADFTYIEDGKFVAEDKKGVRTPAYILKRKMLLWFHKIRIRET